MPIYDRHIPIVEDLIAGPTYEAPEFYINPEIKDFYQFTVDDLNEKFKHGSGEEHTSGYLGIILIYYMKR